MVIIQITNGTCLDYKYDRVYITPHVVFDESVYPLKSMTLADKQTAVETQTFPPALISLPSHNNHATQSVSNTTQAPIIDSPTSLDNYVASSPSLASLENSADSSPSFISPSQTPTPTPPPVQRMTTRAMRGITKTKHILDLTVVKTT